MLKTTVPKNESLHFYIGWLEAFGGTEIKIAGNVFAEILKSIAREIDNVSHQ